MDNIISRACATRGVLGFAGTSKHAKKKAKEKNKTMAQQLSSGNVRQLLGPQPRASLRAADDDTGEAFPSLVSGFNTRTLQVARDVFSFCVAVMWLAIHKPPCN
jgi:hypothetical protein